MTTLEKRFEQDMIDIYTTAKDLIFDTDKLQAICGDLPSVDSIDDSKAKLKVVADSTGYDFGNLISILTTSFIKNKNEDYQCILALLRSIIER